MWANAQTMRVRTYRSVSTGNFSVAAANTLLRSGRPPDSITCGPGQNGARTFSRRGRDLSAVVEGLQADVVLQGGEVKGIGLVRALVALTDAGYRFNRISGTSAGAIVGSLAAAGLTGERLRQSALSLKYVKFKTPPRSKASRWPQGPGVTGRRRHLPGRLTPTMDP